MNKIFLMVFLGFVFKNVSAECEKNNSSFCKNWISNVYFNELNKHKIDRLLYEKISSHERLKKFLSYVPFYPDSQDLQKKIVQSEYVNQRVIDRSFYWLSNIIDVNKYVRYGKFQLLKNMLMGDDWVVGYYLKNDIFVEFIDGRVLTVYIENKKPFKFDDSLKQVVVDLLKKHFNLFGLSLSGEIKLEITFKNEEIICGSIQAIGKREGYLEKVRINKFLIFNKYAMFQITKVNHPVMFLPEKIESEKILGGIKIEDDRTYKVFSKKTMIDWDSEVKNTFPSLNDSIDSWLGNAYPLTKDVTEMPELKKEIK